jgi:hypothetical protein
MAGSHSITYFLSVHHKGHLPQTGAHPIFLKHALYRAVTHCARTAEGMSADACIIALPKMSTMMSTNVLPEPIFISVEQVVKCLL